MLYGIVKQSCKSLIWSNICIVRQAKQGIRLNSGKLKKDTPGPTHIFLNNTIQHNSKFDGNTYDYDQIKQAVKKKKILDIMTQKPLSPRKKRMIKTYGSNMIAEMYLDLMTVSEAKKQAKQNQSVDPNQSMNPHIENPQENNLHDYVQEQSIFNSNSSLKGKPAKKNSCRIRLKEKIKSKFDPNMLLKPVKVRYFCMPNLYNFRNGSTEKV